MSDFGPIPSSEAARAPQGRATFFGTNYHKVSGKNQVAIPKQHKRALDEAQEGPLLLMRWQNEPYLRLYTKKQFDQKLDEVKQKPNLSADEKAQVIEYMARVCEPVEPDSQGRFVLPGKWMEALSIRDEVAFCGAFTFIKIWPADLQRDFEKSEEEKLAPISEKVTNILNL